MDLKRHDKAILKRLKDSESRLKETSQMLENIAQGITDGVLLLDRNFKILWANNAVLNNTGYSMKKVLGGHCYKVTHRLNKPCSPPHDICPVHECVSTGKTITVTHTHIDKKGDKFFVEVTAYPVKNEKEEIIQFVHISKNITPRVQTERKLEEQMEMLKRFRDATVDQLLEFKRIEKENKALKAEINNIRGVKNGN